MPYEVEDEIDWSDSPLGPPSPERSEPLVDSSCVDHVQYDGLDTHDLFVSETTKPYRLPIGSPLLSSTHIKLALHENLTNVSQLSTPAHASKPCPLVHSGPE
jgi:hypothetical protein